MEKHTKENRSQQFAIKSLSFGYQNQPACLQNINLQIDTGAFVLVIGHSGSGKTTLLKQLKPQLTPNGYKEGTVYYKGVDIDACHPELMARKIGYVFQNPEHQIVTDTVYHELAFGLENLGMSQEDMEIRIGEVASFFGIQNWFEKSFAELSGGQKQILNLAAILVMDPDVILLDEPTSQLDPIAATNFIDMLRRIKEELGITIILSEHRVDDVIGMANQVVMLHAGKVVYNGAPQGWCKACSEDAKDVLPVVARLCEGTSVLSVAEARTELQQRYMSNVQGRDAVQIIENRMSSVNDTKNTEQSKSAGCVEKSQIVINLKDVWFRYDRDLPDVLKGVNLSIEKGECFGIVGGNGVGKSTLLKLLGGYEKAHIGRCKCVGKSVYLPQNPQSLFLNETVEKELEGVDQSLIEQFDMLHLLLRHPYDLSGGEQQRLALLIQMKAQPDILLLDEPTKGLDSSMKVELAQILKSIQAMGKTIVMVSHDIDFIAMNADRCGLLFNGRVTGVQDTHDFMVKNQYYTTVVRRVTRGIVEGVTTESEFYDCINKFR